MIFDRLLHLGPVLEQETQIAHKVAGALAFTNRANDHPDAFGDVQFT